MSSKFDRKTFDPANNPNDAESLYTLRGRGRARAYSYRNGYGNGVTRDAHGENHVACCGSTALRQIHLIPASRPVTLIDVGCGDSVDVLIAKAMGYDVRAFDLFEPSVPLGDIFARGDVVESIPLADGCTEYVLSQAMIDLVAHEDRPAFYNEIRRVLAAGGVFSQTGVELHCGHGFNNSQERGRVREAGFRAVSATPAGFVAVK
jgi:Methyltransferase domain